MKVFENIQKSDYLYKEKLTEIVNELTPIRGSERDTKRYYDENLSSDIRLKKWKDERKDAILNDCLDINPHLSSFKLGEKEIPHNEAPMYRYALLDVLSDDKYSFGYVYWLLASERNRELGYAYYDCVFGEDSIDYSIRFDIEETTKEYYKIKDAVERYDYMSRIMCESDAHTYNGELKKRFNLACEGMLARTLPKLSTQTRKTGTLPIERASNPPTYTPELLQLFKGHEELITELMVLSNNKVASKINEWAKTRDKFGKPLIENPGNGLKSKFAKCLKENGIITESASNFRKKL